MPDTRRCFLACNPDPEVRSALTHLIQTHVPSKARPVAPVNLHMTLVFLGNLAPGRIELVKTVCGDAAAPVMDLSLDRVGFWPRRGILWAGCRTPRPELAVFVAGLYHALNGIGMDLDPRPFVPHVTLARRVRRAAPVDIPPIPWRIQEYVLMASEPGPGGVRYLDLTRFPAQKLGTDPN